MADQSSRMTTESGYPISNNQNSLTAGPRGPMLMQDFALIEKMAAFNRERVPERVVHAKGYGAHGTFTVTHDISQLHAGQDLQQGRQHLPDAVALLDRRRRERFGRHRPRPARLLAEVLHRGRQLGPRWQQHADLLHPRPAEVLRLHPHPEARPGHPPQAALAPLGLLGPVAGSDPPGDDPVLGPRHAGLGALHARLWQPHLQLLEQRGRADLGQVPHDQPAGHQERVRRRGDADHGRQSRQLDRGFPQRDRATATSRAGR